MHIIRLRRPWRKSFGLHSVPLTVDVPDVDGAATPDQEHTATYRRSFNQPTGLEPSSRVQLRVERWQGVMTSATLNNAPLQTGSTRIDTDITDLLQPQNQLAIVLTGRPGQVARLSGEVTLAISEDP